MELFFLDDSIWNTGTVMGNMVNGKSRGVDWVVSADKQDGEVDKLD